MATIEEFLGTDIAHVRDLRKTLTGDLDTLSGLENLQNALFHRLITVPGSLVHRPTYGVGVRNFQNAPLSLAVQRQLAIRIQEQFLEDDRVEELLGVSMVQDEANPHKVVLTVRVKIVGYGESALKFTPFGEGL